MPRETDVGSPQRNDPTARLERLAQRTEQWFYRMLEVKAPGDIANRVFASKPPKPEDHQADFQAMQADPNLALERVQSLVQGGLSPARAALEFSRWWKKQAEKEQE